MTVANKKIRVSSDDVTYYTLPGNAGQLSQEGAVVDDTVFGFAFKSEQPTLINGTITSPAFYKGFAGYIATLKQPGTPTATVGEAATLVSGETYQVTNTAKRVMDRTVAPVVKDNGVDQTVNVLSFDYLFGQVTFQNSYTVIGPVTIDYTYLPMVTLSKAASFTLTQTAEATETTDLETASGNSGHRTFQQGLKTCSLEVKGFYDSSNGFITALNNRTELVIEISPPGSDEAIARGFFRPSSDVISGNVGAIEDETVKYNLTVPDDDLLATPFDWAFVNTTLSTAVQKTLNAWLDGSTLHVQYLPDGVNGFKGDTVVTSVSLAGGVDTINTFNCTFQISGGLIAVP